MTGCVETIPLSSCAPDFARVAAYHYRTKHALSAYARGPETLDWSAQPDPFRTFGTEAVALALVADSLTTRYADLCTEGTVAAQPLNHRSVSMLLELSLAISAWKEYGPDRWALRCNPSSGNLHPTEGYVLTQAVTGLDDGVYHYLSREHALERRFRPACAAPDTVGPRLWIGLSSIHWREAWKYGERAFRYCQLDMGHALGAFAYAAAALGWRARVVDTLSTAATGALLGLDRSEDFSGAEPEDPEVLLEVDTGTDAHCAQALPYWDTSAGTWYGRANLLDPHPIYHWPVIDDVSLATRKPATAALQVQTAYPTVHGNPEDDTAQAAMLIRRRRSAQAFDGRFILPAQSFFAILTELMPDRAVPWATGCPTPFIHPVLFVHRVEGLAPGIYALPRSPAGEDLLRATLRPDFSWTKPDPCPAQLPLFRLVEGDGRAVARTLSCHQHIAADGAFTLGMLAEFRANVEAAPWRYRSLHWEAGLIGQVLYLAAERCGLRGTGIGCYLDDSFHEILGIADDTLQSLYHFTVGLPIEDRRILSLPAYPDAIIARTASAHT